MSELRLKLKTCLERCNLAYQLYQEDKKYYQAKRIFRANNELYDCLQEYLYIDAENTKHTINFMFHLEDWFEQFSELEKLLNKSLNLNSEFIFTRLENSPVFPINFLDYIK